jgi:hypothetical protein
VQSTVVAKGSIERFFGTLMAVLKQLTLPVNRGAAKRAR